MAAVGETPEQACRQTQFSPQRKPPSGDQENRCETPRKTQEEPRWFAIIKPLNKRRRPTGPAPSNGGKTNESSHCRVDPYRHGGHGGDRRSRGRRPGPRGTAPGTAPGARPSRRPRENRRPPREAAGDAARRDRQRVRRRQVHHARALLGEGHRPAPAAPRQARCPADRARQRPGGGDHQDGRQAARLQDHLHLHGRRQGEGSRRDQDAQEDGAPSQEGLPDRLGRPGDRRRQAGRLLPCRHPEHRVRRRRRAGGGAPPGRLTGQALARGSVTFGQGPPFRDNGLMTEPQQATATPSAVPNTATAWSSSQKTPLRQFLRTETGSAAILGGATLAALLWSNLGPGSYENLWSTALSVRVAGHGITMDLREFVNSGLMALFFLVVGLEARREFDMGELRVRSRLALPFMAGLGGMLVPIAIYLAINGDRPTAHGWGAAMSTDTAFALGALALAGGKRLPDRIRTYLLTFSVVDDLLGLAVIAVFYSSHVRWMPLLIGVALLAADGVLTRRGMRNGPVYLLIGVAAWVAFWESGVDPIVSGLVIGLLTCAYPAAREDLQQATDAFRLFREQPTARLAAEAREVVRSAISPNERLQDRYHMWTSYVIVPLFALANADIKISGSFLAKAYTSPATLGIMIGYDAA